jgi:periplasmic mercuric ion binding protein
MKTIRIVLIAALVAFAGVSLFAQNTTPAQPAGIKTEKIKVWGNCSLCKTRIEKAAKIKGVNAANWDQNSKILTLVYNPTVTNSDAVQKKIAAVGHDTEKYRAPNEAYDKLDACCKYERTRK